MLPYVQRHKNVDYTQTDPVQRQSTSKIHYPHLASMEVCEQKFPVRQYSDTLPPSTYRHKLRWTKSATMPRFTSMHLTWGKNVTYY